MITFKDLYEKYGIKTVKSALVRNKEQALDFAEKIGYPLVLKIESPDILHKSDIGGVKLNIRSPDEVEYAYDQIIGSVRSKKPDAEIEGVLVQEMLGEGFELIFGYDLDKQYGPVLMFGMGGIFTEAFKDIVFRTLPIEEDDAVQMIDSLQYSKILLEGFRNIPAVSKEMLVNLICKTAKIANDISEDVESFDINPAVVWGNEYRVVDFKYIKAKTKKEKYANKINIDKIDKFFNTDSIAVVGATNQPDKIGYIVLDNICNQGYKGKVFPVNPNYDEIIGLKCYKSILEIPESVELAIVTISLAQVPLILDQCRQKGVSNLIIISAGGKEIGENRLEEKIKKIASDYGIRIIGCNCLGVFDSKSRIDTLFQPYDKMKRPGVGNISLISQSGTVGIAALEILSQQGISKFISYGNRMDVDEGDLISFLSEDESTGVIGIYIEGLEKGRKFYTAAKEATNKKPIVIYKAGRTPESMKAALSHTGFLTGTHNLIKGVMDQAGITQVDSFESFIASLKTLSLYKKAAGNKAMIITNGAGVTIQAIDRICTKNKLDLAVLKNNSKEQLVDILPRHVSVGNPIDLTGTATDEQYEVSIRTATYDDNIDIIMVWFVFQCKPITENISAILKKYSEIKPIICGAIGADHTKEMGTLIKENNIPIFSSVEKWVSAAEAISNDRSNLEDDINENPVRCLTCKS